MNEFAIEWVKGANYAGVTVPTGTALKSKLLRLADEHPEDVKILKINNALVNNCVGFGLSPFYGTQKVVVYDYLM